MIDLGGMKKKEILERAKWKCPLPGHSKHNGLEHPRCYEKFFGLKLGKECILDIEAEDLKADYGIVFCWCVLDLDTNKIFSDVITKKDIKKYSSKARNVQPKEDKRIIASLVSKLSEYERVIHHYGKRYDLPFVRTRAVINDVYFPTYGILYQTDTWEILKVKFRLSRNSLKNSTLKLFGKTRKDHLSLSIKHGCLRGEKWALDIALRHCEKDVLDTRDLFRSICSYKKKTNTSI